MSGHPESRCGTRNQDREDSARVEVARVLVVDDSALIRTLLSKLLNSSSRLTVVDTAANAQDAREKIKRHNPDVVTLDIEMPGMDGITFLEKIMRLRPTPVVMCSTLTQKGADATMRALEIGAVDFIPKPQRDLIEGMEQYADEMIETVWEAAQVSFATEPVNKQVSTSIVSVMPKLARPHLVAIGSSTGGTVALDTLLKRLPADAPPIVIAQHIPAGFSAAFTARINEQTRVEVKEAESGDELLPGRVMMAPGGRHLRVNNRRGRWICELYDGPKVNQHKPSVDVLFASVLEAAPREAMAVMLTGMGRDGAQGMKDMHDQGLYTVAQDEKTSLVWGMPKQAINLGGVSEVAPLENIARLILEHAY